MRVSGALAWSGEPDAVAREAENVRQSERTKAPPSPAGRFAPLPLDLTLVRPLRRPQRPQLGANVIPFAIPSSAPTLDGGFCPADHSPLAEVDVNDLAHVPAFLLRPFGLGKPPPPSGAT